MEKMSLETWKSLHVGAILEDPITKEGYCITEVDAVAGTITATRTMTLRFGDAENLTVVWMSRGRHKDGSPLQTDDACNNTIAAEAARQWQEEELS